MVLKKMVSGFFLAALVSLATLAGGVHAEDKVMTPTTLAGGKIISAEEAKALLDRKKAIFFDMRSPINFGKGHIPGAIPLPYQQKSEKSINFDPSLDQFDYSRLPKDKKAVIVFYSDGPAGWKSYKAAVLSIKQGYRNILWFRGGFTDWPEKGYPVGR